MSATVGPSEIKHAVCPDFCIWVSESQEAWCKWQGLRSVEGRTQVLLGFMVRMQRED